LHIIRLPNLSGQPEDLSETVNLAPLNFKNRATRKNKKIHNFNHDLQAHIQLINNRLCTISHFLFSCTACMAIARKTNPVNIVDNLFNWD